MAISVDTVYQRVLALANKEQRGYITPQEFNLLANQAQMTIFESYFYNKNMRERLEPLYNPETDETNISELISRKLFPFKESLPVTSGHTFPATTTVSSVAYEIFQYGRPTIRNGRSSASWSCDCKDWKLVAVEEWIIVAIFVKGIWWL